MTIFHFTPEYQALFRISQKNDTCKNIYAYPESAPQRSWPRLTDHSEVDRSLQRSWPRLTDHSEVDRSLQRSWPRLTDHSEVDRSPNLMLGSP
jgi:hypothetical protein